MPSADPMAWHPVWARDVAALWPGLRFEHAAEVDSTNTRLLERARNGDARPCLLWAEHQTAGRGRLGRPWWSGPADGAGAPGPASLTFSIGVRLAPSAAGVWSGLSLAVGVALADSLGHAVRLKWPNDLWLQDGPRAEGRKLGGVLIETLAAAPPQAGARHAVVGVGINLDRPAAHAGIAQPVAGWREIEPRATASGVLERVAPAVLAALKDFEGAGFRAFQARFARRDALAGRPVRALSEPGLTGVAEGVDERGALRVSTASGLRLIDCGEVSGVDAPPETVTSVRPC